MRSSATRHYVFAEAKRGNQALRVGAGIYLFMYCAFALFLGLGLYDVAQPRRYQGPDPIPHPHAPAAQIVPEERLPISNEAMPGAATGLDRARDL